MPKFRKLTIIKTFILLLFVAVAGWLVVSPQPAWAQSIFCILSCNQPQAPPPTYGQAQAVTPNYFSGVPANPTPLSQQPYRHSLESPVEYPAYGADYMYPTMELQLLSDQNRLLETLATRRPRCNSWSSSGC